MIGATVVTVMYMGVGMALVPFIAAPFLRISVEALDRVEAGAFVGLLSGTLAVYGRREGMSALEREALACLDRSVAG